MLSLAITTIVLLLHGTNSSGAEKYQFCLFLPSSVGIFGIDSGVTGVGPHIVHLYAFQCDYRVGCAKRNEHQVTAQVALKRSIPGTRK
jgi:hypothetical protein